MCKGKIVTPAGNFKDTAKSNFSLMKFFKKFWERITCLGVCLNQFNFYSDAE